VLDAIGGITHLYHSYRSLRDGGKLVVYGFSGAVRQGKVHLATILANAALLGIFWLTPGKSVMWYTITHMKNRHPEWYREDLMILFDWLKQKRIQPLISRRLSLTQAAQAHTLLERSAVTGKIVLVN
jgi:NADPH:quinone reductase-like Zn-dependent oxidoreductase